MATRLSQFTPRPPPPSPSLRALLHLVPPSPILSPSDLSTSITSGEIPILFPDNSSPTALLDSGQHCLLPRTREFNLSRATGVLDSADHDSSGLDSGLCCTSSPTSTFDPASRCFGRRLSLCWSSDVATGNFIREDRDKGDHLLEHHFHYEDSWISACMSNPGPSAVPEKNEQNEHRISQGNLVGEGYLLDEEALFTQDYAPASTPNSKQDIQLAEPKANLISFKEPLHNGDAEELRDIDLAARHHVQLGLNTSSSKRGSRHALSTASVHRKSAPDKSPRTIPTTYLKNQPGPETSRGALGSIAEKLSPRGGQDYGWLRHMTVSLLIDQEGFRTIQPIFKQTGISKWRLLDFDRAETDIVTFTPAMKQTFRFHYALFDSLPIFRRLMVNNDSTRDYLSRQAYLGLKTTGVYSVRGIEIESATQIEGFSPGPGNQEPAKLFWQFDYCVEDRKVEQSNKNLDGERILIPLTFSCSPRLLNPNQGKKINLMQVMKKAVAAKLTAEKIQQPADQSKLAAPETSRTAAQHFFAKSQAWNTHRRVQSNPREAQTSRRTPGPLRRRRASSAGGEHIEMKPPIAPVSPRYILPPSRLPELLGERQGKEFQQPLAKPIAADPLEFFPLKPSPRLENQSMG